MRISSSITLMLKLFIPLFWGVIFSAFTVMIWVMENEHYLFSRSEFKIGTFIFVALGLVILYFTLFSLKRVETDDTGYIITNFFQTYHFPHEMVQRVKRTPLIFGFELIRLKFNHKTSFGKSIFFVSSRKRYEEFLEMEANKK